MRTKKITYDPSNYKKGMAAVVYGKGNNKIKKQKVVTKTNSRGTKTKTVNYGPVGYYGKQSKTKTITRTRK